MAMWAGGVALGSAVVARWRIVGPGFSWLAAGVIVLLGLPAATSSGSVVGWLGVAAAAAFGLLARRARFDAAIAALSGLAFLVTAAQGTPVIAAIAGALFLGLVTTEMMLGHWYLVDPRLPRWALRALAIGAAAAAIADVAVLAGFGVFGWAAGDGAVGVGYIVLAVATVVLMAAVVGALREEGYSGVMAATGLSYLALLTAIGSSALGRMLASGPVLG